MWGGLFPISPTGHADTCDSELELKTNWPLTGISVRSSSFVSLVFFTTSIPFAFNTSTHLGSTSSLIKTFCNVMTILNGLLLQQSLLPFSTSLSQSGERRSFVGWQSFVVAHTRSNMLSFVVFVSKEEKETYAPFFSSRSLVVSSNPY